jgi:probable HAF family extracellular repeat protein
MKKAHPSLTIIPRITLAFLLALSVGAMALLSFGTKSAESQQAPTQPLYEVHDLGVLPGGALPPYGGYSHAFGINEAGKVVGASTANFTDPEVGAEEHPFLYSNGVMSDLGTLGGPDAFATDINDADKVIGSSTLNTEAIERHAFLYSGQEMQDLGTLQGYSESYAAAINNNDEVVGSSTMTFQDQPRAFLYSEGVMRDLGTLGGTTSYAIGINEAGKVVGGAATSNYEEHAYLYGGGQMQDLGTLGGSYSRAYDINDADKIVGSSTTRRDAEQHTFLYSGQNMQDLGTLEGYTSYSYPTAINNADQVVGQSSDSEGTEHPFLYSDGVMRDLNSLIPADSGWELTKVSDINDKGYIVGLGVNSNVGNNGGEKHAFLLKPLPYFDGFYQPVDNLPTLNKTKPGKTIPIRFSLGGDKGLDIFADGYPKSEAIPCDSTATVDGIEETVTGKGGLSYNASTDQYEYAWATGSTWSGCRQFVMKLKDGTVHRANFIFR